MFFGYGAAMREAKRMNENSGRYTVRKKWYGFVVVACQEHFTSDDECICDREGAYLYEFMAGKKMVTSKAEAKRLIVLGAVKVNGTVYNSINKKVLEGDKITLEISTFSEKTVKY